MPFSVGIPYEIKDANDQMHNLFLSIIKSAKQIHLCCTFLSDIIYSAVVGCNATKMTILGTRPKKRNLINFFFCAGNGFSFSLVRTNLIKARDDRKRKENCGN